MNILQNAVDSIIVGIEDYNMNSQKRLISSTRNIYAGILLLFKYKLVQLSPQDSDEVLIKQKLLPKVKNDNIEWVGKGKKTVDTFQIKERFEALNIDVDWKKLDKINKYRNNIEHYYSTESKESIQSLISNSFLVIRDFIKKYLNKDPKELLGHEVWSTLLKINEVHEAEKKDCIKSLKSMNYTSEIVRNTIIEYSCEECGSDLIEYTAENSFECKSCSHIYEEEELIEKSLIDNTWWRHGEEAELIDCPECDKTTYLVLEKECQLCNLSIEDVCTRCGSEIIVDELEYSYLDSSALCSYCIHQVNKND